MKIEIFGPGCAKCQKTSQEVEKVIEQLGVDAALEHVTDIDSIVDRGVMMTPALAVDGQVKAVGKVLSVDEIKKALG